MKKWFGVAVAFLLLTSAAFAQFDGTISGTVLAEINGSNVPLPFAHVGAFRVGMDRPIGNAMTDSMGNYVMHVPDGDFNVHAEAMHFLPLWYNNVPERSQATVVTVADGQNPIGIDFLLHAPPSGTISGIVQGEVNGVMTPLPFAHVMAFAANFDRPIGNAISDSLGQYTLHVPYGDYNVKAEAMHFLPEWYNNVAHRTEATVVTVGADQNPTGIDFSLAVEVEDNGSISGRVLEQGTENGIGMAIVVATLLGNEHGTFSTHSNMDGSYILHELPNGSYLVGATKFGWAPGAYPETLVVNNNTLTGIDIFLQRQDLHYGSIAGTITDSVTTQPIDDAEVMAIGTLPRNVHMAETHDDGTYIFEHLISDTYTIRAMKERYNPGTYPDSIVIDSNSVTGINIALAPMVPTGISGHVTNAADSLPIDEAMVNAIDVNNPHNHHMARTHSDGSYFIMAPAGEYVVQATARGFTPQEYPQHVTVTNAIVEGIDFALGAINFGSIAGTVSDSLGNPVGHALVQARNMARGHFVINTRTDSIGAFLFDHVMPGSYRLMVHQRHSRPTIYPDTVVVADGQNVTGINIVINPLPPPFNGTISGTVTDDSTAAPIANAMVVAIGPGNDDHHRWEVRHAFTDSTGAYAFERLPQVAFKLFSAARGYIGEFYDNVEHFQDATPVTPNATGINFALTHRSEGPRLIAGQVVIASGFESGGSIVYASQNGVIVDAVATDIDGYFNFESMDPGNYAISAFSVYGEGQIVNPVDAIYGDVDNADVLVSPTSTSDNAVMPTRNSLSQNYPNPFNAETQISFNVAAQSMVELSVYNIVGQKVAILANGSYQPGQYSIIWNGRGSDGNVVASGVYYYSLRIGDKSETLKMTLLK